MAGPSPSETERYAKEDRENQRRQELEEAIPKRIDSIHSALMNAGAKLDKESDSGSRYYTLPDGRKVRVSDHAPNAATQNWIDQNNVEEIPVDSQRFGDAKGIVGSLIGDSSQPALAKSEGNSDVDTSRQLGLYARDREGNPVEVGERAGQANLFNPNKYQAAPKPEEPSPVKPKFDPKHTAEMFPEKKEAKEQPNSKPETPKEPWLQAEQNIKPYADSLRGMSDKELKAEEKRMANALNAWASRGENLGGVEGHEHSERFNAVLRELDARREKAAASPVEFLKQKMEANRKRPAEKNPLGERIKKIQAEAEARGERVPFNKALAQAKQEGAGASPSALTPEQARLEYISKQPTGGMIVDNTGDSIEKAAKNLQRKPWQAITRDNKFPLKQMHKSGLLEQGFDSQGTPLYAMRGTPLPKHLISAAEADKKCPRNQADEKGSTHRAFSVDHLTHKAQEAVHFSSQLLSV